MDLNPTDAALLAAVLRHPRRGVVVARAVYGAGGEIVDFAVQRSNDAARSLLGDGVAPGGRLAELGGALVAQLASVVDQGGFGELEHTVVGADGVIHACALGDRVVLQVEERPDHGGSPDRWFRGLVESTADVIHVLDRDGLTLYISPGAAETLGYPPEDVIGAPFWSFVDPRDAAVLEEAMAATIEAPAGSVVEREFRVRHGAGDVRWIHGRATNHLDTPGLEGIVATWRDVTVPRATHVRLEYAATHDLLTGLPNRSVFGDHLELAMAGAARRPGSGVAVLFCDLDDFKVVNDSLGHAAGDDLLRQVAHRLRDTVRPGDTVSRFGGDEFAVLCDDVGGELEAAHIAERTLRSVSGSYRLNGASREVFATASIGVAVSSGDTLPAEDADMLLQHADTALYEAKRRGRRRVELFSHPLRQAVRDRLDLESELRAAVDDAQFELRYQPKLDLRSGRIIDAEALLRWAHPTRGVIGPDAFLWLAQDTGLMLAIGAWVLDEAVRQAAAWQRSGFHLVIDVNLSVVELTRPSLVGDIAEAVSSAGVEPSVLNIEITEHAPVADLGATLAALNGLRELGTHVTLDDFGTGYSSLTWLQELPVDSVKLDRSLTARLPEHDPSRQIISSIIDLNHALGHVTIAEGVETPVQLEVLAELGCDHAQGYLIGRPVRADQLRLGG
jgi:diguanylate cyclase (GGDEF)-like protein/PAS domain S-box-containing protein